MSNPRTSTRVVVVLALALLWACDRQPDPGGGDDRGVRPVLVAEAVRGGFAIERRSTGLVRAERDLTITVREPGRVASVSAPSDAEPVRADRELLRLSSPELELELAEAGSVLESQRLAHDRRRQLADLGLASRTEVEESEARMDRARIAMDRLLLRQASLTVTAPGDGVLIHERMPAPGQWCAAGLEIARVVDLGSQVVEVTIPTTWSDELDRIGEAVIEVGGRDGIAAEVGSVSAGVDASRGGRILTLVPSVTEGLVPGSRVAVRLIFAARTDAISVPVEAMVLDEGAWFVFEGPAPGEQAGLRRRPVVPGPTDGRRTVIESGLEPGAWVVLASDVDRLGQGWGRFVGVAR